MKFTKMHGTGNDFIVFAFTDLSNKKTDFFKKIADRHTGIGCDQILAVDKSSNADFSMKIWNADGSEAETCGNGLRAVAKYIYDSKLSQNEYITIETPATVNSIYITTNPDGTFNSASVDMGTPTLIPDKIPVAIKKNDPIVNFPINISDKIFYSTCLSTGNPHCVIFVEDFKDFDKYAPQIETDPLFPERTNVEFVKVIDTHNLQARVWERGAKETLSCGSGASAIGYAAVLNQYADSNLNIHMPGGSLKIQIENNKIKLTGGASTVYNGEINTLWLKETKI